MQVKYTKLFADSKKKIKDKKILEKIDETLKLLEEDSLNPKLELKKITCKRDKNRHSVRVKNSQYRILFSLVDNVCMLVCACKHDRYDIHNKNC
jgi:mRNA-degrading endonuclease RelE of RelBE toxin-antitoxin system